MYTLLQCKHYKNFFHILFFLFSVNGTVDKKKLFHSGVRRENDLSDFSIAHTSVTFSKNTDRRLKSEFSFSS